MWIYAAIALILAGLAYAAVRFALMRAANAATARLGSSVDSTHAQTQAATEAQQNAKLEASNVLRASSDDLRRRVEQLRARGRAGK
jgi:hypothetical protein